MTQRKSIEEQLKEQGLRLAKNDESGWYVLVWDEDGKVVKVRATDVPQLTEEDLEIDGLEGWRL